MDRTGKWWKNHTAPWWQSHIQKHPVEEWPALLAMIPDEAMRERVRLHLKTVYFMRKKHGDV